MTNGWAIVTATGLLIIFIGLFLTPSAFALVYLIGGGLAASGLTAAILSTLNERHNS